MALTLLITSGPQRLCASMPVKYYSTLLTFSNRCKPPNSLKSFIKSDSFLSVQWTSAASRVTKARLGNICSKCYSCFSQSLPSGLCRSQLGNGSRWITYKRLPFFANYGRRLGKPDTLHIRQSNTNAKVNAKKSGKRPAPKATEVKRILFLAKPEKWKLTGWIILLCFLCLDCDQSCKHSITV